jgi:hypothetical protein
MKKDNDSISPQPEDNSLSPAALKFEEGVREASGIACGAFGAFFGLIGGGMRYASARVNGETHEKAVKNLEDGIETFGNAGYQLGRKYSTQVTATVVGAAIGAAATAVATARPSENRSGSDRQQPPDDVDPAAG